MHHGKKVWKRYCPIHFTIGTSVEVTFSHLKFRTTQKYFDAVLYRSISSIFCISCSNFLSHMLNLQKLLKRNSPIHFTIKSDVEVTFSHVKSIKTHNYLYAVLYIVVRKWGIRRQSDLLTLTSFGNTFSYKQR